MQHAFKHHIWPYFPLIARIYLAIIWIMAGWTKIGNYAEVSQSIMAYEIFTPEWSMYLAHIIGPVELIGGLLLLIGAGIRYLAPISLTALVLFIIGLAQALARGINIDCGCFGTEAGSTEDMVGAILRDIAFIALTLMVWLSKHSRKLSVDRVFTNQFSDKPVDLLK